VSARSRTGRDRPLQIARCGALQLPRSAGAELDEIVCNRDQLRLRSESCGQPCDRPVRHSADGSRLAPVGGRR
jgi:hypothetical protein